MNKAICTLLTIITFDLMLSNANADERMTIIGMASCGSWIENKNNIFTPLNRGWLLGFMSGLAIGTKIPVLEKVDQFTIYLWMDKYCNENPLSNTGDGGMDLFNELKAKKGLK